MSLILDISCDVGSLFFVTGVSGVDGLLVSMRIVMSRFAF